MMVVPRVERDFEGGLVSVNGLGFVGMLLVNDKGQGQDQQTGSSGVHAWMEGKDGPIAVLNAVTYPS